MAERVKQAHLPDMEPPSIPEIDDLAEKYYGLNDKSWKLRGKVEEARDELLEVMKKHELFIYSYDNKQVLRTEKEIVKVKKKKAGDDNGDDE